MLNEVGKSISVKGYCYCIGTFCEYLLEHGYCSIASCVKRESTTLNQNSEIILSNIYEDTLPQ